MILLNLINFGLVGFWSFDGAVMPLFLTSKFALSNAQISLILGIGKIMIALSLFFGLYSDYTQTRHGKRIPLMLIGGLISAPLVALIPHAPFVWVLVPMLSMAYFGMQFAAVPFYALVPEVVPNEKLGTANAFFSAFSGLGTVVAYAVLLSVIYKINKPMAFYAMAAIHLVGTIVTVISIRERASEKAPDRVNKFSAMAKAVAEIARDIPRLPDLSWFMAANLFFWLSLGAFIVYFTKFMEYYVNVPGTKAGEVLALIVVVSIIFAFPAGMMGDRISRRWLTVAGMLIIAVGFLIGYFTIGPGSHVSGYDLADPKSVTALSTAYGYDLKSANLSKFTPNAFRPALDINRDGMEDRKSDVLRWCLNGELSREDCRGAAAKVMGNSNPAWKTTISSIEILRGKITAETARVLRNSYIAIAFAAVGLCMCMILMATILPTLIPEKKMGLYMGFYSTFTGIGQFVSLLVAGIVIDATLAKHIEALGYRWIFIQGTVLMAISALLVMKVPYIPNAKDPTITDREKERETGQSR